MTKNIIFGKNSKLTSSISRTLENVEVFSSNKFSYQKLEKNNEIKANYIFNNFYPSFQLNDLNTKQLREFVDLSIVKLVEILSNLESKNINKIIYTSSSSVYNLDESLKDQKKDQFNRILYSSFKYSAEKLIQNYCEKKNIKFFIMRLFNTYGDEKDQFSLIEKLITPIQSIKDQLFMEQVLLVENYI